MRRKRESTVPKSAITSFSEAIQWKNELKPFAAEKGLDLFLNDLMSAEAKLQQVFVHQTRIDSYFRKS